MHSHSLAPPTFADFLSSLPLPGGSPFPTGYTSSLRSSSLASTYSKSIAIHKELSQLDYNVTPITFTNLSFRTLYRFFLQNTSTLPTPLPSSKQRSLQQHNSPRLCSSTNANNMKPYTKYSHTTFISFQLQLMTLLVSVLYFHIIHRIK